MAIALVEGNAQRARGGNKSASQDRLLERESLPRGAPQPQLLGKAYHAA